MNKTLTRVLELIETGNLRISSHGYDELSEDGILVNDILNNVKNAIVLEDYKDFPKGPCILVLQHDTMIKPIHVVWGIPKNSDSPAVLVTAYRPDPNQWNDTFTKRLR